MKGIKPLLLVSYMLCLTILNQSCEKDPNPDGSTGENCETVLSIQERLEGGETPQEIFECNNTLLDSLYGKIYEGGLIFHYNTADGTGLIAALSDIFNSINYSHEWGCIGIDLDGIENTSNCNGFFSPISSSTETGSSNTLAIVNSCVGNSAANTCASYNSGINSDWFLPSLKELDMMWKYLKDGDGINLDNTGGFNSGFYWSSSEKDDLDAFGIYFGNGNSDCPSKSSSQRVRPVRAY